MQRGTSSKSEEYLTAFKEKTYSKNCDCEEGCNVHCEVAQNGIRVLNTAFPSSYVMAAHYIIEFGKTSLNTRRRTHSICHAKWKLKTIMIKSRLSDGKCGCVEVVCEIAATDLESFFSVEASFPIALFCREFEINSIKEQSLQLHWDYLWCLWPRRGLWKRDLSRAAVGFPVCARVRPLILYHRYSGLFTLFAVILRLQSRSQTLPLALFLFI